MDTLKSWLFPGRRAHHGSAPTALLYRAHKDLRPTPEGQVALQHALSLVQGAALLSHEVTRMTKLDAGEVCFGSDAVAAVSPTPSRA